MHRTNKGCSNNSDDMVSGSANNCGSNATDKVKIVELGVKG